MCTVWVCTVDGEMNSSAAIWRLVRPAAKQAQDLELAFGEVGRQRRQRRPAGLRRRRARRGPRPGPAAARTMTRAASPGRSAGRCGRGLAERVPDVGRGEQARGRVQLGGAHAGRVPGAVDALVVAAHDRAQRREHRRPGQDPAGVVRVQAHQLPLLGPQRAGPLPDAGRDGDPAEVMHQPGPVDERAGRRPRSPRAARRASRGDPARVALGTTASSGRRRRRTRPAPRPGAASSRNSAPRPRLGVDDRGPEVVRARERQQLARRLEEDRGDRRVERAARPAGHRLGRELARRRPRRT